MNFKKARASKKLSQFANEQEGKLEKASKSKLLWEQED